MIGIVVVSHSPPLARAACDFALAFAADHKPTVEIAAGDNTGGFGTSARAIAEAITRAGCNDGVLVFTDLGSALLNAEMAVELLGTTSFDVVVSAAPFVEGLAAACASAAAGASLIDVEAEACRAGRVRAHQLRERRAVDVDASPPVEWDATTMQSANARVAGEHGLHARPSARLIEMLSKLDARVRIRNHATSDAFVDASSISSLMALGAATGDVVTIETCGNDAGRALADVIGFLAEPATARSGSTGSDPVGVSPGIAIGIARRWRQGRPNWSQAVQANAPSGTVDPAAELENLRRARRAVHDDLTALRDRLAETIGAADASILDSWSALIDDRAILDPVERRVNDGEPALRSWISEFSELIARITALPDPYLRQRATDIGDIRDRVASELIGTRIISKTTEREMVEPAIIVAEELSVADVAELDTSRCLGIITAFGSVSSHASIMARSLGIPAVLGASPDRIDTLLGRRVLIDGSTGDIVSEPTAEEVDRFQDRRVREVCDEPVETGRALTQDGIGITVAANIGSRREAEHAVALDADGVGLLRTEFMFANWRTAPSEEEQYQAYADVARQLDGQMLTIRTFDGASDKPLWFLGGGLSTGHRGLTLSLDYPEVLLDQLSAIARVAERWPLRLLLPFVLSASDVRDAKNLLQRATSQRGIRDGEAPADLHIGAMIERPGAAQDIAAIASEVDFLSIGTNDLAAVMSGFDRARSDANYSRVSLDPAVLRLIHLVASERPDMSVSVCGELANELDAVPILIGLGIDQLSVRPTRVGPIKQEIRRWSQTTAQRLAMRALELADADEVCDLVRSERASG